MNILWPAVLLIHFISTAFMGMCILRLFAHLRRHKFQENRHTLLFGFIATQHIVIFYIAMVGLYAFFSVILLLYLSRA